MDLILNSCSWRAFYDREAQIQDPDEYGSTPEQCNTRVTFFLNFE